MAGNECWPTVLNELSVSKSKWNNSENRRAQKSELNRARVASNNNINNNNRMTQKAAETIVILRRYRSNAHISDLDLDLDTSYIICRRSRCRGLLQHCNMVLVILFTFYLICSSQSLLVEDQVQNVAALSIGENGPPLKSIAAYNNNTNARINGKSISSNNSNSNGLSSFSSSAAASGYLDNLDNLERSVGAVLIKVAYGTTSTTKRSIPENSYILGLTTVATPLLTTLRYQSAHQPQNTGSRHRNYELDLERDHALPTSAPNADILKSNNNPTYPNPNRHHSSSSHERDRHRLHTMQYNSTPMPSIPNLLKKTSSQPTIPMYPGDVPSYSPPSRSFFTPPLPPEYQNPFADKPTLRGTNNEGLVANTVTFNNRRPIPPPSLMPGHERIPFRPPDLAASMGGGNSDLNLNPNSNESHHPQHSSSFDVAKKPVVSTSTQGAGPFDAGDRKKALNTPSRTNNNAIAAETSDHNNNDSNNDHIQDLSESNANKRQEILPNIIRILGKNGQKGDIPAVLLRQVTQRPFVSYHQPPASPIVSNGNAESTKEISSSSSNDDNATTGGASPNINKSKQLDFNDGQGAGAGAGPVTTPSAAAAIAEPAATSFTSSSSSSSASASSATTSAKPTFSSDMPGGKVGEGGAAAAAAAASAYTTWAWAWNIHIYLSVVLFTILSVYSLYKLLTYNKLTHLFAQSYFVYIHLTLIAICIMRIFYLCFDAYNIHGTFHIFAAELLLNLPSTFLTVAFSVLILFLFLKSLNHKNNRYSALVRPLTVVVGCGVHVGLCITLHYVESYTLQNHHMYFQQQQQQQFFRRQQQQLLLQQQQLQLQQHAATMSPSTSLANPPPPPRVLSLICQIIYIFICLSLGLLYLYLYRILKRILRSKSQNYIHGYQNLSYAIHITIATALLFVLLAVLQIFGAVCISTARPLMSQANIVEVDWLQWGYQFSLRLIEIAIITLISWVTGLKTSVGSNANAAAGAVNGDVRMVGGGGQAAGIGVFDTANSGVANSGGTIREKHHHHNHNSNVANFFLPCTSSSSQEQFDTDYPAICNANTNLHTYTMRTGKLIYDDSYALNSLAGPSATSPGHGRGTEYQLQEPMYQRPYDTGSIRSAVNHNIAEYGASQPSTQRYHNHHMRVHEPAAYMSANYMTDATTDHYENPNFDLRTSSTGAAGGIGIGVGVGAGVGAMQKAMSKNTASSGSASASASGSGCGSGSGSSGTSQQQMLLLQSDSCYSEPLQENSSYEFNNFERPIFKEKSIGSNSHPMSDECWPEREREREREQERHKITKGGRDRKQNNSTLERATFENNPERRSSNSTNSCSSSNGIRYASYNSYERAGNFNGVRKSGTLNNIVNGSTTGVIGPGMGLGTGSGTGTGTGPGRAINIIPGSKRVNVAQTLALSERSHYYQRNGRTANTLNTRAMPSNDLELVPPSTRNELALKQHQNQQQLHQQQHQQYNHNNSEDEEDEEEEDDMISGSNVECTNLISNTEHASSCIANDTNSLCVNNKSIHLQKNVQNNTTKQHSIQHLQYKQPESPSVHAGSSMEMERVMAPNNECSGSGSTSSASASESMIVAEQGFLRFRASDNINDTITAEAQPVGGGGSHNVHHQSRSVSNALSQICSNVNGIDC